MATDRAWAQSAATGKADSVVGFWTEDARVAMAGQAVLQGKAAIRDMVKGAMATPGFRIAWAPENAEVSAAGDLGYTFGTDSVTGPNATGKLSTEVGNYVSVWRKGADGRWRCVMDYATPGPAAAAHGH